MNLIKNKICEKNEIFATTTIAGSTEQKCPFWIFLTYKSNGYRLKESIGEIEICGDIFKK